MKDKIDFPDLAYGLAPLVREKQLTCAEVDEKIASTASVFFKKLDDFKSKKKYINAVDENEQNELLEEFEGNHWGKLSNWLVDRCSVRTLINPPNPNYVIPDSVLNKYSLKTLDIYAQASSQIDIQKVRSEMPWGCSERQLQHLIEMKLAVRGEAIDNESLVAFYPIKTLQPLLSAGTFKKPKDRAGWVKLVLDSPEALSMLKESPEIPSLFKILPIPEITEEEFQDLKLMLSYSNEYAWAISWFLRYKFKNH